MSIKLRKKADEIYKQIAGQPVRDAELGDGEERSEAKSSEAGGGGFAFLLVSCHTCMELAKSSEYHDI